MKKYFFLPVLLACITFLLNCESRRGDEEGRGPAEWPHEGSDTSMVQAPPGSDTDLEPGRTWRLQSYGPPNNPTTLREGEEVTLTLNMDSAQFAGQTPCGPYNGRLEDQTSGLQFTQVSEKMEMNSDCSSEQLQLQNEFLSRLRTVRTYEMRNNQLFLFMEDGQQLLFN